MQINAFSIIMKGKFFYVWIVTFSHFVINIYLFVCFCLYICLSVSPSHPLVLFWSTADKGPFKCYVTQMGVGGGGVSDFLEKSVTKV